MTEMLNTNLGPHPQFPKSVKPGIPKLGALKPGWKRVRIGDLFEVVSRPVDMRDDELYTLVTVKRSRGGVVEREKLTGKKISVKSQFYIKAGDFLISKRQIVHGACGFVPKELDGAIVSNEYAVLRCNDSIQPEFLACLIHTPYFQQTCFHSSIGVHVEKMIFKLECWFDWIVYVPNVSQQKEIADFIQLVDKKTDQLIRGKSLLDVYKNGLMHDIFSQKIYFKKNYISEFGNWVECKLSSMANRCVEKKGSLSLGRVFTNSATKGVIDQKDYFDKDIANANNLEGYYVIEDGDYVYNPRIYMSAPVGPINKNNVGKGLISPLYTVFRFKMVNNSFYEKYFQSTLWHRYMRSVANYGVRHDRMNISTSDFMSMPLPVPSEEEQRKIVDFLNAMDKKIEAVSKQIEQLEKFKKGLLQKIFV